MLKAIGIGGLALLMFVSAARGQGGAVPPEEASRYAPAQIRQLVSGRVQVTQRMAGRWRGSLLIRRFSENGRWNGCVVDREGKVYHQKIRGWSVTADSRGRARLFATRPAKKGPIGPCVIHYDPNTGRLLWRRKPPVGDGRKLHLCAENRCGA